jgi:hypothetical protein
MRRAGISAAKGHRARALPDGAVGLSGCCSNVVKKILGLPEQHHRRRSACHAHRPPADRRTSRPDTRSCSGANRSSRTRSKSAVSVSTSACAGTGSRRSLPQGRHDATRTCGLRRTRRISAEPRSVKANSRLSSDTNHTGVATPVPSRLKLVILSYRPAKTASKSAGRSTVVSIASGADAAGF